MEGKQYGAITIRMNDHNDIDMMDGWTGEGRFSFSYDVGQRTVDCEIGGLIVCIWPERVSIDPTFSGVEKIGRVADIGFTQYGFRLTSESGVITFF